MPFTRLRVTAIALGLATACAGPVVRPEAPLIVIDTVRPSGAEGSMLRIVLSVRLHNSSASALELKALNIALNGKIAAADTAADAVRMPPAGDVTVEIARRIPQEAVASALLPIGPNRLVQYEVNGVAVTAAGDAVSFTGKGTASWAIK